MRSHMFCCKFQNEIRTRFFCIVCGTNEWEKFCGKIVPHIPVLTHFVIPKKYFCSLLTFSAACVPSRSRFQSWNYWNGEKLPYPSIYSRPIRFTPTVQSQFTSGVPSSCSSLASSSSLVSPPGMKGKWWWAAITAKTK